MIKAGTQENSCVPAFCFSYNLRKIPPFREYALPLKRESIHEDWSTNDNTAAPTFIAGILHFVQNDRLFVYRHSRKGKTREL